jgi:hypothetical protein
MLIEGDSDPILGMPREKATFKIWRSAAIEQDSGDEPRARAPID